jgi:hypothetical protein
MGGLKAEGRALVAALGDESSWTKKGAGMSFTSVRIAKGVRISASSRGLRAHVGPRGARVHFGGGRTGMSTGTGPFTYYTSLSRSGRSSTSARTPGASKSQITQMEKEREFLRLREVIQRIVDIHRADFPTAQRPSAPTPEPVDEVAIRREKEKRAPTGCFALEACRA